MFRLRLLTPTPAVLKNRLRLPTPTPEVLKNRLRLPTPTPADLKTDSDSRLRLQLKTCDSTDSDSRLRLHNPASNQSITWTHLKLHYVNALMKIHNNYYSLQPFIFYEVAYKLSPEYVLYIVKLCQTRSSNLTNIAKWHHFAIKMTLLCCLGLVTFDYFFFIIEPRKLKFGMRMPGRIVWPQVLQICTSQTEKFSRCTLILYFSPIQYWRNCMKICQPV